MILTTGLTIGLAACPTADAQSRVVRVGVVDVEPLAYMDGDRPAGLFVELVTDVAAQQGWDLRFKSVAWDEGIRALAAGELDLLPTVAYSAARDSVLDFCAEHVVTLWSQVYKHPDTAIENVTELDHRRVAVMRGDINGDNFRVFVQKFDVECDLVLFDSHSDVFAAVRDGRAAAGVAPNLFGRVNADQYGLVPSPILFAPFPVYFATTEGRNHDIVMAIDAGLRSWRTDEDSYYHRRLDAWLGQGAADTRLPSWAPATLVGLVAVALLLVLWNRSLKRSVRQQTRELEFSELRFRAVFESAGDAVSLMSDECFVEVNPRTLELFRCTREEIVGHSPQEFSPPVQPDGRLSAEAAHERMQEALSGDPLVFEWRHCRADGTLFDAEVTLNALDIAGTMHMQASVRDITRRKQLEANLRQAQKMEAIGTLAGGIAHDFNNILAAIMGYNELARSDAVPGSEQESYLVRIGRGAERARDLVLQILAFSRQSAEVKQPTDLAPIVEEALKLLRSSIPATIEIRQALGDDARVMADPTSMHQIVMNLGTNAYQALSDSGGVLDVRLEVVDPPAVQLTVGDDGPGMSPDVLQKIFEPYFTTKTADRGTGLGLAVVHGIVEDHGGTISVDSMVGQGTTFRVRFPVCTRRVPASDAGAADRGRAAGGEHVLLVDDEEAIVHVFESGLRRLGYRVTAFTDPERALAALRADPTAFDVMVTDMTMPRLTGAALTQAAVELNPDLPVLLCTGYSDGMTVDTARELGVRDLVMKPVEISQLAHRIRMVLASVSASG